jgi:hypothetical protein
MMPEVAQEGNENILSKEHCYVSNSDNGAVI